MSPGSRTTPPPAPREHRLRRRALPRAGHRRGHRTRRPGQRRRRRRQPRGRLRGRPDPHRRQRPDHPPLRHRPHRRVPLQLLQPRDHRRRRQRPRPRHPHHHRPRHPQPHPAPPRRHQRLRLLRPHPGHRLRGHPHRLDHHRLPGLPDLDQQHLHPLHPGRHPGGAAGSGELLRRRRRPGDLRQLHRCLRGQEQHRHRPRDPADLPLLRHPRHRPLDPREHRLRRRPLPRAGHRRGHRTRRPGQRRRRRRQPRGRLRGRPDPHRRQRPDHPPLRHRPHRRVPLQLLQPRDHRRRRQRPRPRHPHHHRPRHPQPHPAPPRRHQRLRLLRPHPGHRLRGHPHRLDHHRLPGLPDLDQQHLHPLHPGRHPGGAAGSGELLRRRRRPGDVRQLHRCLRGQEQHRHRPPENTASGVVPYLEQVTVEATGHADLVNVAAAVANLGVASEGALTLTGANALITRPCDTDLIGEYPCNYSSPETIDAVVNVRGHATLTITDHATLNRTQLRLGDTNGFDFFDPTLGTVSEATLTGSTITAYPASLTWTNNTFTRSTLVTTQGAPQVRGNSFAGADVPVTFVNSTDVSGVKNNTATGPAIQRIFRYSGTHVTGHWTPENTASGVVPYLEQVTVEATGHADLVNVAAAVANLGVASEGALTLTGANALITRPCDTDLIGEYPCNYSSPETIDAVVNVRGHATLTITDHATLNRTQLRLGDTNGFDFFDPTLGTVSEATLTGSTITAYPASLTWTNNTFTRSTLVATQGAPQVRGNSFAGADVPVTFVNSTDVSGVKNNTATGPAIQRIFRYSGTHVTGHWTPENTASGVVPYLEQVTVEATGHADLVNVAA